MSPRILGQEVREVVKKQIFLIARKDRKWWRAMIVQAVKGTQHIEEERY